MSYLDTTHDVYKEAALTPNVGLCCTTNPVWELPGLKIPTIMQEMNYGCGSTVHPRDLAHQPKILYVGVGGGMELLQFAYFSRQKGGVIGIDVVDEMLEASKKNFVAAPFLKRRLLPPPSPPQKKVADNHLLPLLFSFKEALKKDRNPQLSLYFPICSL